jgi:hypothetical protein
MRILFFAAWLSSAALWSQTTTNAPVAASRLSLWNCKFSDGNFYSVSLGAIDSVSQHEYLLDGALRVVEVTVATRGSTQARFYVLEKPSTDTGGVPGQSLADGLGRVAEEIASRAPGGKEISRNQPRQSDRISHPRPRDPGKAFRPSLEALSGTFIGRHF